MQDNRQNIPPMPSSKNSLTVSPAGIEKALRYLGSDQRPTAHTPLLPPHVCDAVIGRFGKNFTCISDRQAREAVLVLLAGYPGAFAGDEAEKLPYMERIKGVFTKFPAWAVAKAVEPGFRFGGNPSFRPNDKEVAAALEKMVMEHGAYAVRAGWHKAEGERRAAQARMDAAPSVGVERIAELVSALRATPVTEPVAQPSKHEASAASHKAMAAEISARRAAMTPDELVEHDATLAKLKDRAA